MLLKDRCSFPKERRTRLFFSRHGGGWGKELCKALSWCRCYFFLFFLFPIHHVRKLNHANALSNYCHGGRTPTFNAVKFIVKRQEIISMFFLFLNVPKLICMSAGTTGFLNGQPLRLFLFPSCFLVAFLSKSRTKVSSPAAAYYQTSLLRGQRFGLVQCRGILIRFKLIH